MKNVAVILTYNEELHIERCINSVINVFTKILVVDSLSSDRTIEILKRYDVQILQNPFKNQAQQFNWALSMLDSDTDWVFRIDADEYIDLTMQMEIQNKLVNLSNDVNGVIIKRSIFFQNERIQYGGMFPISIIRLFRYGKGCCEDRWMDEHIIVDGQCVEFKGELIDRNLNSLSWWINKHNNYASREAIEMLNLEYKFLPQSNLINKEVSYKVKVKRLLKNRIYFLLPKGFRAGLYFMYRYILRLGFLDGVKGFEYNFLQGFWYRYLVDAKITEVKKFKENNDLDIKTAIQKILGIKL